MVYLVFLLLVDFAIFFSGCSPLFFSFFCRMLAFMFCGSFLYPFISSVQCFITCFFGFFLTFLFYLRSFPFILQFVLLRCSLWLRGVKVISSYIGINFGLVFLLVVNFWKKKSSVSCLTFEALDVWQSFFSLSIFQDFFCWCFPEIFPFF